MEIQVSVQDWLQIPMKARIRLREVFSIPKSRGSLVEGNVVKSDGTTHEDLKHITVPKMQAYLESEELDFVSLFNSCVDKVSELDKELEPERIDPNTIILEEWASRLSHMVLQAGNLGLTDALKILINKLLPYEPKKEITGSPAPAPKPAKTPKAKQQGTPKGSPAPANIG